jgi:hypothetical protein
VRCEEDPKLTYLRRRSWSSASSTQLASTPPQTINRTSSSVRAPAVPHSSAGPLDVVPLAAAIGGFEDVATIELALGELSVRVITIDEVIASKEKLGRPKDTAALPALGTLPLHHRDPFDRLLIAQADLDDLALVSADGDFRRYGITVVW